MDSLVVIEKPFYNNFIMAVITVEPAGKASLVYSCMQTRLMAQYNRK